MAESPFAHMMKHVRAEALRDHAITPATGKTPAPVGTVTPAPPSTPPPMVPHEVLQRARTDMEQIVATWSGDAAFATDTIATLRERAVEIRLLERASHFAVFQAGKILTDVKASLPHGQFQDWLHNACGMHQRSASRYMSAYRTFEHASRVSHLPMRLIYRVGTARLPDADKQALADAVCHERDPKEAAALIDARLRSRQQRRRAARSGPAHVDDSDRTTPAALPPGVQRAYDLIAALEDLAQQDLASMAPVLLEHLEDLRHDIAAFLQSTNAASGTVPAAPSSRVMPV